MIFDLTAYLQLFSRPFVQNSPPEFCYLWIKIKEEGNLSCFLSNLPLI